MILRIIFIFLSMNCLSQNGDGFCYSIHKPSLSSDSLENLVHQLGDSFSFHYLKANLVTRYIINPKDFKRILKKKNLSENQKSELMKTVQIQYDWALDKKNKYMEKLFVGIYERDQKERDIMTDCYVRTKNNDSCRYTNNMYAKMLQSDSINRIIVDSIAKTYGFPKKNWLGKGRGGYNTFMHHHLEIFKKNYDLFVFATKNSYFSEIKFKTLEDFKLLSECKNQKYNTVYCGDSKICTPCQMKEKCCEK